MSLLEELKSMGVNVDEGVERLMGNSSLYERMLGSFAEMMQSSSVQPDFDAEDYTEIIERAHAVKGAAGNLSITPVYESYSEIVNLLRSNQPEQARAVIEKVLPVQEEIVHCIEKHM